MNIWCMPKLYFLTTPSAHGASAVQQLAVKEGQKSLAKRRTVLHGLGQVLHLGMTRNALHAGASDRPQQDIKISRITIHANPLAD